MLHNVMFNYFDAILLFIILLSSFLAFNKGFIKSVLSLSGWIFSIIFTCKIFPYLEPMLLKHTSKFMASLLGYCGLLIVFLLFFAIFNYAVCMSFGKLHGSTIDKLFGAAFGIIRGLLVILIFFITISIVLNTLNDSPEEENNGEIIKDPLPHFISHSVSYEFLLYGKNMLMPYIPELAQNILLKFNKKSNNSEFEKMTLELTQSVRLLSKYADVDTLKTIKDNAEKEERSGKSELEVTADSVQALLAIYLKRYSSGAIAEHIAISESELNHIHTLLKKANKEIVDLRNNMNNRDNKKNVDIIEQVIERDIFEK